ncbi:pentapeptide repeat-containing protein [Methanothermococcus sp.]|uniref:pentapeptide repeat-containing protein n=1 Tax=Methanothermococcus sp. TaxID=2614238 RepID=UPI0025F14FAC|nr:pentapeptide repeat-containing protein [Methanothermococcus sp.]
MENREDFKLNDCVVGGIASIEHIYNKIKNKKLKGATIKEKDDEIIITIDINVQIFKVEFKDDFIFKGFVDGVVKKPVKIVFTKEVVFWSSTFNGDAYFGYATFEKDADFRDTIFNGWAYFSNTTFEGDADFSYTKYKVEAYFSNTTFNKKADNKKADFSNTTFEGDADFSNTTFNKKADFKYATTFKKEAYFIYTMFEDKAYFSNTTFEGNANFSNTIFKKEAYFGYLRYTTTFKKEAYFSNTTFNKKADFGSAIFEHAIFKHTTFKKDADFKNTISGILEFDKSTFEDIAYFRDIYFGLLSFIDCTFKNMAEYRYKVKSEEELDKINKEIVKTINKYNNIAIFNNAQFLNKHTKIINFQLSKTSFLMTDMREVMLLHNIEENNEKILSHIFFEIKKENKEEHAIYKKIYDILREDEHHKEFYKDFLEYLNEKSVLAEYRNLRLSIEDNITYEEASDLYKLEMEFKKEYSENDFEKLFIHIYGIISDYGESVKKIGWWIICILGAFTILASSFRCKRIEWDIFKIVEFWWISFIEVIRISLQMRTNDKSLWALEPFIRMASLILLGNLYIALRRRLSRK